MKRIYELSKQYLVDLVSDEIFDGDSSRAAVMVDLHLDPRNYTIDRIMDHSLIQQLIAQGCGVDEIRGHLVFENTSTMLGIFRVHCRNLVNRSQGMSFINQGGINRTKAPKLLAFLDSLCDDTFQCFDDMEVLASYYFEIAKTHKNCFNKIDIENLKIAKKYGQKLDKMNCTKNGIGMTPDWLRLLKGIRSGLWYFKSWQLDGSKYTHYVKSHIKSYNGIEQLMERYIRDVNEVSTKLAPNFFADLGFKEFCKPDVHVAKIMNSLYKGAFSDVEIFRKMLDLARENNVPPRQLDKIFYLTGSGDFYLSGQRLPKHKTDYRREGLLQFLRENI